MKGLLLLVVCLLFSLQSSATSNVSSLAYASTNVTTSAYVQIVASTPINSSNIVICDTSGVLLKLAIGSAGHEVDFSAVPISSCMTFHFNPPLLAGVRLSLEAISGTASTGFNSTSLLP